MDPDGPVCGIPAMPSEPPRRPFVADTASATIAEVRPPASSSSTRRQPGGALRLDEVAAAKRNRRLSLTALEGERRQAEDGPQGL